MTNPMENLPQENIEKLEKFILRKLKKSPPIPMDKSYHYEGHIKVIKVRIDTRYGGSLNVKVKFIGKTLTEKSWLTKRKSGARRNYDIRNNIERCSDCVMMAKMMGLRTVNVESITVQK